MNWLKQAWTWVREGWTYLMTFDPTTLKGIWMTLAGMLAAAGITLSDKVNTTVTSIIAFLVVVLPIVQTLWSRRGVVAQQVHDAAVTKALYTDPPIAATTVAASVGDAIAAADTSTTTDTTVEAPAAPVTASTDTAAPAPTVGANGAQDDGQVAA